MTEQELKTRAFQCEYLGEILGEIADLSIEDQMALLRLVVGKQRILSDCQHLVKNGLPYMRCGWEEDRIQAVLQSGFIPPGTDIGPDIPPRPKKVKTYKAGFVYLMRTARSAAIKIGFSTNPRAREATLQSEDPELELIFKRPGTTKDERDLHERFKTKRLRGEWFSLSAEDVSDIMGAAGL